MTRTSRDTAQHHESGHAVVAIAVGWVVACIEIEEHAATWAYPPPGATTLDPVAMCLIACGGHAACGERYLTWADADTFARHGVGKVAAAHIYETALRIVTDARAAVDALAEVVERKRVVRGPEIRRVALAAAPHLRPLAVPFPRKMAEQYERVRLASRGLAEARGAGFEEKIGEGPRMRGLRVTRVPAPEPRKSLR